MTLPMEATSRWERVRLGRRGCGGQFAETKPVRVATPDDFPSDEHVGLVTSGAHECTATSSCSAEGQTPPSGGREQLPPKAPTSSCSTVLATRTVGRSRLLRSFDRHDICCPVRSHDEAAQLHRAATPAAQLVRVVA